MDELERAIRAVLTDDRLELPLTPGAVDLVHEGVRRRRRRRAVAAVGSVAAAVVAVAATAALVSGPGGRTGTPPVTISTPTPSPSTKPSPPPTSTDVVPWAWTTYDYRHPPRFPGAVADPQVPWCRADQLSMTAQFQGATGSWVGSLVLRNTTLNPCAVQGQPAVTVLDASDHALVSSTPEPFYVDQWVRLAPGATASAGVTWMPEFCGEPAPATIAAVLPHRGGRLTAPMSGAPRCDVQGGPPTAGRLEVAGFVAHPGLSWTPDAGLLVSMGSTPRSVVAGGVVTYRLRVQAAGATPVTMDPCLPFRERLVRSGDGSVEDEELYVLNCSSGPTSIGPASSGHDVFFDIELRVPPSMPPGSYALVWQSVLEPVSTTADNTIDVVAAPPMCTSPQLALTVGRRGAATGHYADVVILTNTSSSACSLRGYPGVQFADPSGRPLPTTPHHGGSFTFPDLPLLTAVLGAHGGTASFEVGGIDFVPPAGQTPCARTGGLLVIPPGLRRQVLVRGAGLDCQSGLVDVSVVVPGSAGPRP